MKLLNTCNPTSLASLTSLPNCNSTCSALDKSNISWTKLFILVISCNDAEIDSSNICGSSLPHLLNKSKCPWIIATGVLNSCDTSSTNCCCCWMYLSILSSISLNKLLNSDSSSFWFRIGTLTLAKESLSSSVFILPIVSFISSIGLNNHAESTYPTKALANPAVTPKTINININLCLVAS